MPSICSVCRVPFLTTAGLRLHVIEVHREETTHRCKLCLVRFLVKSDLLHHLRTEGHLLDTTPPQLRRLEVQRPAQKLAEIPDTHPQPAPLKRKSSAVTSTPQSPLRKVPIKQRLGPRSGTRSPKRKRSKGSLTTTAPLRSSTSTQRNQQLDLPRRIPSSTYIPSSNHRADKEPVQPRVISLPGYTTTGSLRGYTIPKQQDIADVIIHATQDDQFSD